MEIQRWTWGVLRLWNWQGFISYYVLMWEQLEANSGNKKEAGTERESTSEVLKGDGIRGSF